MPDRVVWLPTNSPGCTVRRTLRATSGAVVTVAVAEAPPAPKPGGDWPTGTAGGDPAAQRADGAGPAAQEEAR
jgi:NADH-quinone oxidoreductase subunit G